MPSNKKLIEDYLNDIKVLSEIEGVIDSLTIEDLKSKLRTSNAQRYLKSITVAKPEILLSEFLFRPLLDQLGFEWAPEIKLDKRGWVDYLIKTGTTNPVAVELKPMHKIVSSTKIKIIPLEQIYNQMKEDRDNQIIRYLKASEVDYVVLTNLIDVYYFNREAVYEFKPFHQEKFEDFVRELAEIGDFWELVRRKEDKTPRHDLDEMFFNDLKGWYTTLEKVKWKVENPNEHIVHLINKFIFIKTLEDHSLIPFRFLHDAYTDAEHKWSPRGMKKVLEEFFKEIDSWFYTYYDTELFKKSILEVLEDSEENMRSFGKRLKLILGVEGWRGAFQRGLLYYNFRKIDEDVFGKAYEMFLAERRKQMGIYYTPSEITRYMAKKLVKELFEPVKNEFLNVLNSERVDKEKAWKLAKELTSIAILDPACGSGSFLIKVLREVYKIYEEIDEKTKWAEDYKSVIKDLAEPKHIREQKQLIKEIRSFLGFNLHKRNLISLVILRHIYGVDLDERAIDVAKVNIWKEAIKLEPSEFRYKNLKSEEHILPDLEMNLITGNSIVSLPDNEVVELMREFKEEIKELWEKRKAYLSNPFNPDVLKGMEEIKARIREKLTEMMKERGWDFEKPLFYPLEFFFLYFDENGEPLPEKERGFHGVIGNPPWETVEPSEKEFVTLHEELFRDVFPKGVTKFGISGKEFKKKFRKKLEESEELKSLWNEYYSRIKMLSDFVRKRYKFSTEGKITLQKVFIERAMELSKRAVNLLVPSNFHTDEGTILLRKEILENYCLKELVSFENRGSGWFKDVDSRFKFDIVFFTKERCEKPFRAAFYVTRGDYEAWANDNGGGFEDFLRAVTFEYPVELIPKTSPNVLGVVEFRKQKDIVIFQKIRDAHPLWIDVYGKNLIQADFNMTTDNNLFNTSKKGLVLYEGKMIHQYEPFFSEPRYWVEEEKGRKRLLGKELSRVRTFLKAEGEKLGLRGRELKEFIDENYRLAEDNFNNGTFKLDYEEHRLAYRAIAHSTNKRTLISTILPKRVFMGHSLNYFKPFRYVIRDGELTQERIPYGDVVYLMALLNSFTLDYYIRQRVSANLTMFFLYELPIPEPGPGVKARIVELAFRLLYRKGHYDDMGKALGIKASEVTDEDERREMRAELEAIIARDVFGLTKEEMEYILSTFIYGNPDRELMRRIIEKM
ncbi:Eco57I restriction-modification methylase domain-containing protein [Thermococcus sp. PK]|uniref:Eco57I restriction-modification methylase domain-containing protein n=1 Tax=Thermococcus sp. PK TaxID=913025 RepID=UPI0005B28477|nr:N-6 DNA methylase [Thermococcus sp. PK]HIH71897.1 N-6 DNA methylase [Thermococcaceae archaeon]